MHKKIMVVLVLMTPVFVGAISGTDAPDILNIQIREVTDDTAVITWETSEEADSMVNYGLSNNYGIERDPLSDKKAHGVVLTKLIKNTNYHFRVVSSDDDGNQAVSGDFTFVTTGYEDIPDIEKVEEEDQRALVAQVVDALDNISDIEALNIVSDKIQSVQQVILNPPHVIGLPRVESITIDGAVIRWATAREANSLVSLATEIEYDETRSDPYSSTQGSLSESTMEHVIELVGLKSATLYHIKAISEDNIGMIGESGDLTFRTLSHLPGIQNVSVVKTEETSATIAWGTSLPAAGVVEYTDMTTGQMRTQGSPEHILSHTVRLENLTFGTRYSAVVVASNVNGEEVRSEEFSFVTIRDTAKPIISKVANESTLYPGAETKIQTVIGWGTDEPAVCIFKYMQGLGVSEDDVFSPDSVREYKTEHVQVVLEFMPSTVYKFWVECTDHAGNLARSEDFVLFTPEKEKSIIDILMENFEGSFGWIKNMGK